MQYLIGAVLVIFVAQTQAAFWTACGPASIQNVEVAGCTAQNTVCSIKRGANYTVKVDFIPAQSVAATTILAGNAVGNAPFLGSTILNSGHGTCEKLLGSSCPLTAGKLFSSYFVVAAPADTQPVPSQLLASLTTTTEHIACAVLNFKVTV